MAATCEPGKLFALAKKHPSGNATLGVYRCGTDDINVTEEQRKILWDPEDVWP